MTNDTAPRIRCRAIAASDAAGVAELLTRGFPNRTLGYWRRAMGALAQRPAPEGFPQFGYLLESNMQPVGVILMIFRRTEDGDIRCNISSWYVENSCRGYASLLIAAALRHKEVTYLNISPAPQTWPVIEAQGFHRYCDGQMLTVPSLNLARTRASIQTFDPTITELTAYEHEMMVDHIKRGCIGLVAHDGRGAHPFLFLPKKILAARMPALQLVYCRNLEEFVRFAGPIGRMLLARGHLFVLIDSMEKLKGVHGLFFRDRGPKYAKGPNPPRLGDLSFCENILFGA